MKRIRILLFVLVIVALCLAPSLTSAAPTPDLAQDLVALEAGWNIWTIWGDGSHLRQITTHDKYCFTPSLSPDGRKLAYEAWVPISNYSSYSQIRVRDLITGADWAVTTNWCGEDLDPCWSPDGKQLAFARADYSQGGSLKSKIMTTSLRRVGWFRRELAVIPLTDSNAWEGMPAWSPDGKYIAYIGDENHTYSDSIWIASVKNGSRREVAGGQSGDGWSWLYTPTWSPDGQKIAFLRGEIVFNDESVIWNSSLNVVDPRAGSGQTLGEVLFTPEEGFYVSHPSWSPNGWIYFPIHFNWGDDPNTISSEIVAMNPASRAIRPVCSGWLYFDPSVSRNPFYHK